MYKAEILADSLSPEGHRLTTMKITFPRFILAEMNTHRMFSRNSASSRAIPFKKMVKMVEENPFIPIAWQKDHKGMQGTEYFEGDIVNQHIENWLHARNNAINIATKLATELREDGSILKEGVTKQLCNRLLEPFMWHTVIVTATEWENFFKLRCPQYSFDNKEFKSWKDLREYYFTNGFQDKGLDFYPNKGASHVDKFKINTSQADIHIQAIAELMWDAYNESTPKRLKEGEWHIPFGDNIDTEVLTNLYYEKQLESPIEAAVKIATARCARISYETLGDNPKIDYEADLRLHDMLAESGHWSPFEHVARVMTYEEHCDYFTADSETGCHYGWCRNFRGFIQYRHLIDG